MREQLIGSSAGSSPAGHTFIPAIDGLRAVAVLMVLVGHTMPGFIGYGGLGVDLFFAISGYLVGGLLLGEGTRTGRIALGKFYARRGVRLLPALFVMLTVTAAFLRPSVSTVLAILFYVANWLRAGGDSLGPYGHMWSLSVEEQFYLVWPWVVMGALAVARERRGLTRRLVGCVALLGIVIAILARVLWWEDQDVAYNATPARMDGLLWGVLLALALPRIVRSPGAVRAVRAFSIGALCVLVVIYVAGYESVWVSLVLPVLCALVVAAAVVMFFRPLQVILASRAALWLGKISYGVYLWHYPLIRILPDMNPRPRTLVIGVSSIACAALSWYLVERPVARMLRPRLH